MTIPRVNSISGHERNKLFINHGGQDFEDVSLSSGGDSIADGRCFSIWDYDHDGGQDLALINMNSPHLQILRNQIPDRAERTNGFIAIRLIGGNHDSQPSTQWSNRNGIGAQIIVTVGDRSFINELHCGEGFSSQNSNTIVVGIGDNRSADQIAVKWPSGQSSHSGSVQAGSLVSFHENAEHAAEVRSPVVERYKAVETVAISTPPVATDGILNYPVPAVRSDESEMRVMITMATWCESCRKHLEAVGQLREETDELDISWFGVPVDGADSSIELKDYANKYAVPYQMLDDLESKYRQQTAKWIRNELGQIHNRVPY